VNMEAVIVRVQRYTCSLYLNNFGDALGGRDQASFVMHLEPVMV
jgi:hypothetical protein